jgi:DNA polymerase III subunit delta
MHAFEFLRTPGKVPPRPIYAVLGEGAYLRDETLKAIARQALGPEADALSVSRFPGDHATLADVLDEVRTLPFLSKCRVVIVDGADPFITAHRKELEVYAEKPILSAVLVLSVKSMPSNTKLAKLIDKSGLTIDCKSPDERDLPRWLVDLARIQSDAKLEPDAAQLLVELVGADIGLLASEVEKLAVYVGNCKLIRHEDVARMVGAGRVEKLWTIIDAATTGKGAEALADLDLLLNSGEHPIKILAGMRFSLQKVHHAGQLRRARIDLRDACQVAEIHPRAVELTGRQHAHLGPSRVDRLPAMLLQADLDLKGDSPLPPHTILERLLVQLSRKRTD